MVPIRLIIRRVKKRLAQIKECCADPHTDGDAEEAKGEARK
jgi:hypothetical protein